MVCAHVVMRRVSVSQTVSPVTTAVARIAVLAKTAATRKLLSRTCSNPKVHCSNPKVAPGEQLSGFLQSDFRLAAVYFAIVHCNATAVVTDSPDVVARHPIAAR